MEKPDSPDWTRCGLTICCHYRIFLCAREGIAASMQSLEALLVAFTPDVLVDARMRKRQIPEVQRHMAALTIGLGANFTAGHTTHMVIETAWGEQLGKVIS